MRRGQANRAASSSTLGCTEGRELPPETSGVLSAKYVQAVECQFTSGGGRTARRTEDAAVMIGMIALRAAVQ